MTCRQLSSLEMETQCTTKSGTAVALTPKHFGVLWHSADSSEAISICQRAPHQFVLSSAGNTYNAQRNDDTLYFLTGWFPFRRDMIIKADAHIVTLWPYRRHSGCRLLKPSGNDSQL